MSKTILKMLLIGWVCLHFSGCRTEPRQTGEVADVNIEFSFYYRKNTSEPHSVEKKIKFKVDMQKGDIPEIGRLTKPIKQDVGEFQVIITSEINTFYLDVYEKQNKTRYVLRQLYQLNEKVVDQFSGSHGFTGLVYVNHSKSDGELQFMGKATSGNE